MLVRGFADAVMMRSQQALAFRSGGYLPPEHYDQIFSAHGTIMIFFGAMPFVIGLMNFVVERGHLLARRRRRLFQGRIGQTARTWKRMPGKPSPLNMAESPSNSPWASA